MDNELIRAVGGIQSSVDNLTKEVGLIRQKQEEQSQRMNDLTTSFAVYKTHGNSCQREFEQINRKLSSDYITLNRLDREADELKTIASYKSNTVSRFKVFLGIVATIVGLLISINQLAGIKNKVSFKATPAVYATQLDTSRADTLDPFKVR